MAYFRKAWVQKVIFQEDIQGKGTEDDPMRSVLVIRRLNGAFITALDINKVPLETENDK